MGFVETKDLELGDLVITDHGTIWLITYLDASNGVAKKLFPSPAVFDTASWPTNNENNRVFSEGTLIKAKLIQ